MNYLDRDAARDVLIDVRSYGMTSGMPEARYESALDALEGCVLPAPQQTIDRDALSEQVWLLVHIVRDGMWTNQRVEEAIDRILASLRPY